MNPYRIACLGALVCTVVAWILWGPWGGIAVAAPCAILLLIALPHALGAADDVGAAEVSLNRPSGYLTIGFRKAVINLPHDPEWPDWIDAEGEPMPRHDAGHAADAWAYLRLRPDQHTATLREALQKAAQSEVVGVCYLDTEPYHASSPKEDATCRNPPAGSPVSLA
jgi:hypothetical protein